MNKEATNVFCQNCGTKLDDAANSCAACGANVPLPTTHIATARQVSQHLAERGREGTRNAWKAFLVFAANPTGGLPGAFESVAPGQAGSVGIVFGAVFAACFALGVRRVGGGLFALYGGSQLKIFVQLLIVGAVFFTSQVAASLAARKLLRGVGSVQGDLFTAGAALLPLGFYLLVGSVLGAGNFEIIAVLGVFAICLTILMLHAGFQGISRINDPGATLAVPSSLVLSLWLAKVILAMLA